MTQAVEGVVKAVGGGYCRLQMPLRLALGVRGAVAGLRVGALEGGGGATPPAPFQRIPWGGGIVERATFRLATFGATKACQVLPRCCDVRRRVSGGHVQRSWHAPSCMPMAGSIPKPPGNTTKTLRKRPRRNSNQPKAHRKHRPQSTAYASCATLRGCCTPCPLLSAPAGGGRHLGGVPCAVRKVGCSPPPGVR